jgi:GntR family uxuAB operon transcriptional repressor
MSKVAPVFAELSPPETRLYRVVAERIQAYIRDEQMPAGERLPSERDLASQLKVSRASVREALIALELTGVVEVRGGSGIYVIDRQHCAPGMQEIGPGPFEILSARCLIEGEVAAIAARMATDSALDAILRAFNDMERFHDDRPNNEAADRAFHVAIARASGNTALLNVIENLWDQRGRLWIKMEEHFHTDALRQQTMIDHRRILDAIFQRDPTAAQQAMQAHLQRVTSEFSRGWVDSKGSPPGYGQL